MNKDTLINLTSSISISCNNGTFCGSIPRIYGNGEQQKSISLLGKTGINICYKRQHVAYTGNNYVSQPYLPITGIQK